MKTLSPKTTLRELLRKYDRAVLTAARRDDVPTAQYRAMFLRREEIRAFVSAKLDEQE